LREIFSSIIYSVFIETSPSPLLSRRGKRIVFFTFPCPTAKKLRDPAEAGHGRLSLKKEDGQIA
jgi:hypothetical protein